MGGGYNTGRGIMKWRMPSLLQAVVIILIFAVPVAGAFYIFPYIPQFLKVILSIIWFIAAYGVYIYILSHGKGKVKNTITSPEGLRGEFAINNNWITFTCIYPFAGAIAAALSGYYIAVIILILTGFILIKAGSYFKKRIRIDDTGNFYVIQNGEEKLIELSTVKRIESRLKKMQTEMIYIAYLSIYFKENITEQKPVKLKISLLRSLEYGTFSPPKLILLFIKDMCILNGFFMEYLNAEETEFNAEKF